MEVTKPTLMPILQLRIERTSLACESRYTRYLERKCVKEAKRARDKQKQILLEKHTEKLQGLVYHRKIELRTDSRRLHLADAFIRGIPYFKVEQKVNIGSFSVYKPNKFWEDLAREIWLRCNKRTSLNLEMLNAQVHEWRNQHPGHIITEKKQGSLMDIKNYGNMWLHL